jgi:hypothetical protein
MNHGVVMFHREREPESRIWEMAMHRGQFLAVYTKKRMERAACGTAVELWLNTLVPTRGGPPRCSRPGDLAADDDDYARYEPSYDEQFIRMCRSCSGYNGAPTVVLPATTTDEEAMRLRGELHSIEPEVMFYLYERFYVVPRRNLRRQERSRSTLAELLRSIHPIDGWAYFLGFFQAGDGVVVFLADDESAVGGLFEPTSGDRSISRRADWLHDHGVIERW